MKNKHGVMVSPLSQKDIDSTTNEIRRKLSLSKIMYFPILEVIEIVMPQLVDGYELHILTKNEIGEDLGRTYPKQNIIQLREDVYDGLNVGNGMARFTAAHELGHFVLHQDESPMQRGDSSWPSYKDSEWQANAFAASLLMPMELVEKCSSPKYVQDYFGVTITAARIRYGKVSEKNMGESL